MNDQELKMAAEDDAWGEMLSDPARALRGVALGAGAGGLLVFAALLILHYAAMPSGGRSFANASAMTYGVFGGLIAGVVYLVALLVIATPVWWALHMVGLRQWWAAIAVGAVLNGGAMAWGGWGVSLTFAAFGGLIGLLIWWSAYRTGNAGPAKAHRGVRPQSSRQARRRTPTPAGPLTSPKKRAGPCGPALW